MPRQKQLGELEHRVMEFLWSHGPASAETVREALPGDRPLKDSTIRTVLRRLESKNYVRHRIEGRQFVYSGIHHARTVAADAVREIVRKFCRGSLEELLTGMVDRRVVKSAELRRLAEKIDAMEREGKV
jgi:BlaI family transcriptional regulator, penicillinase repressor